MPSSGAGVATTIALCLLLAVVLLGPFFGPGIARRVAGRIDDARDRRITRRPVVSPVGALVDALRRLSRELTTLPAGAPWARQHGTRMAYDKVLAQLCDELGIEHELPALGMGEARDMERLRMEDAIYGKGLRIHTVGT